MSSRQSRSLPKLYAKNLWTFCCPWHVQVPRPGNEPVPQQRPTPQQWQCQILNPLNHQKLPRLASPSCCNDNAGSLTHCATGELLMDFLNIFLWGVLHPRYMEVLRLGAQIRAAAAGPHNSHSNIRSEPHLWPTPQLIVTWILNPLSKARDWTGALMDASWIP